jgi:hypothetical protein
MPSASELTLAQVVNRMLALGQVSLSFGLKDTHLATSLRARQHRSVPKGKQRRKPNHHPKPL